MTIKTIEIYDKEKLFALKNELSGTGCYLASTIKRTKDKDLDKYNVKISCATEKHFEFLVHILKEKYGINI